MSKLQRSKCPRTSSSGNDDDEEGDLLKDPFSTDQDSNKSKKEKEKVGLNNDLVALQTARANRVLLEPDANSEDNYIIVTVQDFVGSFHTRRFSKSDK